MSLPTQILSERTTRVFAQAWLRGVSNRADIEIDVVEVAGEALALSHAEGLSYAAVSSLTTDNVLVNKFSRKVGDRNWGRDSVSGRRALLVEAVNAIHEEEVGADASASFLREQLESLCASFLDKRMWSKRLDFRVAAFVRQQTRVGDRHGLWRERGRVYGCSVDVLSEGGQTFSYDLPLGQDQEQCDALLEEAIQYHSTELVAIETGRYPVVFTGSTGGILIHEICGHLAEHWPGLPSPLQPLIGARVAAESLTVVDDPGRDTGAGYHRDALGHVGSATTLVREGVVCSLLGGEPGVMRAQDIRFPPRPRMSTIVVGSVVGEPDAMLTCGVLVVDALGVARVDHRDNAFEVEVLRGRWIDRRGECHHLAPFVITGDALEALAVVSPIGSVSIDAFSFCRGRSGDVPTAFDAPVLFAEGLFASPRTGGRRSVTDPSRLRPTID